MTMTTAMSDRIPLARLHDRMGWELGPSSWITVDQPRIQGFARCTGDNQWLHVDVERAARESPFGGTVAHGYLTLALLAPTCLEVLQANLELQQALNYGLDKVRFVSPVRAGKQVRNRFKLTAVADKGDGRFLVTTENTMEIEHEEKPALVATALFLLME
jgi:acyl dehydratase